MEFVSAVDGSFQEHENSSLIYFVFVRKFLHVLEICYRFFTGNNEIEKKKEMKKVQVISTLIGKSSLVENSIKYYNKQN